MARRSCLWRSARSVPVQPFRKCEEVADLLPVYSYRSPGIGNQHDAFGRSQVSLSGSSQFTEIFRVIGHPIVSACARIAVNLAATGKHDSCLSLVQQRASLSPSSGAHRNDPLLGHAGVEESAIIGVTLLGNRELFVVRRQTGAALESLVGVGDLQRIVIRHDEAGDAALVGRIDRELRRSRSRLRYKKSVRCVPSFRWPGSKRARTRLYCS